MKISQLETIYKILDLKNKNYSAWYGTQDDIVEYLKEQGQYNSEEGWVKGLEKHGLTFLIIN